MKNDGMTYAVGVCCAVWMWTSPACGATDVDQAVREDVVRPVRQGGVNGQAYWSRECHDLWAPMLERNGVQLVAVGHRHSFDFAPACKEHPWAMVNGGGPELGYRNDWANNRRIPAPEKFPTVVEGKVVNGRLRLRVHDVLHSRLVLDQDIEG